MDMYDQFVGMVADGAAHGPRHACGSWPTAAPIPGGRRLQLGLVDEIGGEIEAREWLARERGVPATTPVRDVQPGSLYDRTFGAGLGGLWQSVMGGTATSGGAMAIWQGGVGS